MSTVLLATQTVPSTPSSGQNRLYVDSTNKEWTAKDDAGVVKTLRTLTNANTADVTATSVDTYLTGSSITLPPTLMRVGATFRWVFAMSKTNAGTTAPTFNVRFGTAGAVGDTSRLLFTGVAQTAAVDNGIATIDVVCRIASSVGVIEGVFYMTHALAATNQTTGLMNQATLVLQTTSGTFDTTVASSIIGVSCNPQTSAVWTFQHVSVQGFNL